MRSLIAVTCHNIAFVHDALSQGKNLPPVSVIDIDHKIEEVTADPHILLVPTVGTLKRNLRVLNDCPNVLAIVFDAPVLCKEMGCPLIDIEKQTLDYVFRYRPLEPRDVLFHVRRHLANPLQLQVRRKTIDMSTKLLKRLYGSVLGKFLTFMYKVPNTDRRIELQKQVFAAWWSGDVKAVGAYIKKTYPKNPAAAQFLADLDGDAGNNFVQAVAELRSLKEGGKPISYDKLSKKHKVSVFDLRYFAKGLPK